MPAKSDDQRRFFNLVLKVRKGETPREDVTKEILDVVDGEMSDKEVEDYAFTSNEEMVAAINEGMRVNPTMISMRVGEAEYPVDDIIAELGSLLNEIMAWKENGVSHVSAPTSPNEWIPLWNDAEQRLDAHMDESKNSVLPFDKFVKVKR